MVFSCTTNRALLTASSKSSFITSPCRRLMIATTLLVLLVLRMVEGMPRCLPAGSPVTRPSIKDCTDIINMITEGDKSSAPMRFSRHPGRGFQVPHGWRSGSCTLVIDLIKDEDDTLKFSEIAFTAAVVMQFCIGRPAYPNLGGSDLAGPSHNMRVIMAGPKRDQELGGSHTNSTLALEQNGHGKSNMSTEYETS